MKCLIFKYKDDLILQKGHQYSHLHRKYEVTKQCEISVFTSIFILFQYIDRFKIKYAHENMRLQDSLGFPSYSLR